MFNFFVYIVYICRMILKTTHEFCRNKNCLASNSFWKIFIFGVTGLSVDSWKREMRRSSEKHTRNFRSENCLFCKYSSLFQQKTVTNEHVKTEWQCTKKRINSRAFLVKISIRQTIIAERETANIFHSVRFSLLMKIKNIYLFD